jgi:hypothetical protein
MIRVELPFHLRTLAQISGREITVDVADPVTLNALLDAVEAMYPVLCGTIRDHVTRKRRAFLRFYACNEDYSHATPDTILPAEVITGKEPFCIIGAIAGGSEFAQQWTGR